MLRRRDLLRTAAAAVATGIASRAVALTDNTRPEHFDLSAGRSAQTPYFPSDSTSPVPVGKFRAAFQEAELTKLTGLDVTLIFDDRLMSHGAVRSDLFLDYQGFYGQTPIAPNDALRITNVAAAMKRLYQGHLPRIAALFDSYAGSPIYHSLARLYLGGVVCDRVVYSLDEKREPIGLIINDHGRDDVRHHLIKIMGVKAVQTVERHVGKPIEGRNPALRKIAILTDVLGNRYNETVITAEGALKLGAKLEAFKAVRAYGVNDKDLQDWDGLCAFAALQREDSTLFAANLARFLDQPTFPEGHPYLRREWINVVGNVTKAINTNTITGTWKDLTPPTQFFAKSFFHGRRIAFGFPLPRFVEEPEMGSPLYRRPQSEGTPIPPKELKP